MHTPSPRFFPFLFTAISILAALLLLASAYGGYVHPDDFEWIVSLTLIFPILLTTNIVIFVAWLIARSRRCLIPFVALLACIVAIRTYLPVNFPQSPPKGSIKVASYNTYGYGYGRRDLHKFHDMLDYLRHSKADILCTQETHYDLGHKQEVEDATAHWRYHDSVMIRATYNALTLYSQYPILSRHVIRSSSTSHICVIYKVKIKADTVVVVNSHFVSNSISTDDKDTYSRLVKISDGNKSKEDFLRLCEKLNGAGKARAEQADLLYDYLKPLANYPIIICGDFNDSPLAYPHQRLTTLVNDAYTAAGNGLGFSYHEYRMYFRLDNILCSSHWRPYSARVDSRQKMSDHYPIEVWLKRVPMAH